MAIQFRESGTILFKASGSVAMDADCCCDSCCTFSPSRELFLTIDNFTLDGAGCDAGCVGYGIAGAANFGGNQTSSTNVSWFGDAGNITYNFNLLCDQASKFSGGTGRVKDGGGAILCYISIDPDPQVFGVPVCDPFYLQGTVSITIYGADGVTVCDTGTMRVTITE